jgi:hypothetical protein
VEPGYAVVKSAVSSDAVSETKGGAVQMTETVLAGTSVRS